MNQILAFSSAPRGSQDWERREQAWSLRRAEDCAGQWCHRARRPERWGDKERMAMQGSGSVGSWGRAGGLRGTVTAEKSRRLACFHVDSHGKGGKEGGKEKQSAPKSLEMIRECHTVKLR